MTRKLATFACLAVLALAACKREEPTPVPQAAAAGAPSPEVVASAPTGETPATAATFDTKGFAGRFSGGTTTLELKPDGTYEIVDGRAGMDGTWTVEAGDTRLRLDPNTKAQDDRVFAIAGHDRLEAVTAAGQPATGDRALSLARSAR